MTALPSGLISELPLLRMLDLNPYCSDLLDRQEVSFGLRPSCALDIVGKSGQRRVVLLNTSPAYPKRSAGAMGDNTRDSGQFDIHHRPPATDYLFEIGARDHAA